MKKKQVNKIHNLKLAKLKTDNNKKYKVKAIQNSALYTKKIAKSQLLGYIIWFFGKTIRNWKISKNPP